MEAQKIRIRNTALLIMFLPQKLDWKIEVIKERISLGRI